MPGAAPGKVLDQNLIGQYASSVADDESRLGSMPAVPEAGGEGKNAGLMECRAIQISFRQTVRREPIERQSLDGVSHDGLCDLGFRASWPKVFSPNSWRRGSPAPADFPPGKIMAEVDTSELNRG
jgi:hypothetical protein